MCYLLVLLALEGLTGCKEAILTAPESATLQVSVNPAVIPLGGKTTVKVTGFKASGTPLPDGTWIFFSTTIGTIESKKETFGGVAEAVFHSNDNRSGITVITVSSGNATTIPEEITITIGASALHSLSIGSDPAVLPKGGGTITIRVTAYDETLNPLPNIPVIFTTTNGHLDSAGNAVITNLNGVAIDRLNTQGTAIISASSGDIATQSLTINIESNENPEAVFEFSPRAPKIDDKVFFNASASTDNDGSIVSYQWDFGDGQKASGVTAEHRYKTIGEYSVVLVVLDNSGNQGSSGKTITITKGSNPTASFIYSPNNPGVNENIRFNASSSSDSDGTIEAYDWDFGDGSTGVGESVTHKYTDKASYKIQLKVTDNHGNTDTTEKDIAIGSGQTPVAQFVFSPAAPKENEEIHFNASSSNDTDGTITSFNWDFGDGNIGSGSIVDHKYTTKGSYNVTLQVTDNSGNMGSTSKSVTVSAGDSPRAAFEFSPTAPETRAIIQFNASPSSDPDGTIVSFAWDFGDGATGSGEKTSHSFSKSGTYKVVLTVTDNDGNKATATVSITVTNNHPPTALFVYSPTSPVAGQTISFNASDSSDSDGTISSYNWDFGDLSAVITGKVVTHAFTTAGTYTVVLTVTDNSGNTNSTNKSVQVN